MDHTTEIFLTLYILLSLHKKVDREEPVLPTHLWLFFVDKSENHQGDDLFCMLMLRFQYIWKDTH